MSTIFTSPTMNTLPVFTMSVPDEGNAKISFFTNEKELLRVAEDGFYVRGQKLEIDDNEAASVYKAFREFLIWSALTRV